MPTIYEAVNQKYSDACHNLARDLVYPKLFKVAPDCITYEQDTLLGESSRGQILDGEMGVDRIVHCKVRGLTGELVFTIQERFRRPEFVKWQDLTVTEWNHATNLPSELSKINAGIFIYGYGNHSDTDKVTDFVEVLAINTTSLLYLLAIGGMTYKRGRNKKLQSFLAFGFKELFSKRLVLYKYPDEQCRQVNNSSRRQALLDPTN